MAAKIGPHDDPVRTHEVGLGDITNTFENNACARDGLGAVSDSLGHLLSVTCDRMVGDHDVHRLGTGGAGKDARGNRPIEPSV